MPHSSQLDRDEWAAEPGRPRKIDFNVAGENTNLGRWPPGPENPQLRSSGAGPDHHGRPSEEKHSSNMQRNPTTATVTLSHARGRRRMR